MMLLNELIKDEKKLIKYFIHLVHTGIIKIEKQ